MNNEELHFFLMRCEDDIERNLYENIPLVLRKVWDEAQRQAAPTWQPIETAPKDGTWILLAGDSGYTTTPFRVSVCQWSFDTYHSFWRDHSGDGFLDDGDEPTHWMPLPPVPPTPKTLSEELSDILSKFKLDKKSVDIILFACSQLEKREGS